MSQRPRIVIVGGGIAALESVLALRSLVGDTADITVIAPNAVLEYQPYSVLLPFGSTIKHQVNLQDVFDETRVAHIKAGINCIKPIENVAVTDSGEVVPYEFLILAFGCSVADAVPGATTFAGSSSVDTIRELLNEVDSLEVRSIAFVVPPAGVWSIPLYELAIQTRQHLLNQGIDGVPLHLVTAESEPLDIFGNQAVEHIKSILDAHQIALWPGLSATDYRDQTLTAIPDTQLTVDAVVSLPKPVGSPIEGIEHDSDGFLPTDLHGLVRGQTDVFAAGDCTAFPLNQGGLAAQQADACVDSIAQQLGKQTTPREFRPLLRGALMTDQKTPFLRTLIAGGGTSERVSTSKPLWWPPGKIAGKYLTPYLSSRFGIGLPPALPQDALAVEVQFAEIVKSHSHV